MATILNRLTGPELGVGQVRLVMIVRNEGHCIERCLSSVRAHIGSWCIVDTGSTDDTMDMVRKALDGLPGQLYERPWVDFGHNRSESVKLAQTDGFSGYFLTLDADEEITSWPLRMWLFADLCFGEMFHSGEVFPKAVMFKAALPWRYERKCHEKLALDHHYTEQTTPVRVLSHGDGGRHAKADWALADLQACLADFSVTGNSNVLFHLAQILEKIGLCEPARKAYALRLSLGGHQPEVAFCMNRLLAMADGATLS